MPSRLRSLSYESCVCPCHAFHPPQPLRGEDDIQRSPPRAELLGGGWSGNPALTAAARSGEHANPNGQLAGAPASCRPGGPGGKPAELRGMICRNRNGNTGETASPSGASQRASRQPLQRLPPQRIFFAGLVFLAYHETLVLKTGESATVIRNIIAHTGVTGGAAAVLSLATAEGGRLAMSATTPEGRR